MIESVALLALALVGVHMIVQAGIARWHRLKFEYLNLTLQGPKEH